MTNEGDFAAPARKQKIQQDFHIADSETNTLVKLRNSYEIYYPSALVVFY